MADLLTEVWRARQVAHVFGPEVDRAGRCGRVAERALEHDDEDEEACRLANQLLTQLDRSALTRRHQ